MAKLSGDGRAPQEIAARTDAPTRQRLERYVELLGKWRCVTNLISDDSFEDVWRRHILDSIMLQREAPDAARWLDFGAGAGLPAVVIACLLADRGGAQVHAVEIDRRKCAFLREVATQLRLPLKVHNTFAQDEPLAKSLTVDIVTARAFAALPKILDIANPYLVPGAKAVLPRGRSGHDEVARLDEGLYSVVVRPNPASDDGLFIHIERRGPHIP